MTNMDRLRIPNLDWIDIEAYPSPIRRMRTSHALTERLTEELGREPTAQEHHAAFQEALGHLTIEVTDEQRRDAVEQAKKMREELTEFIETYGGQDD